MKLYIDGVQIGPGLVYSIPSLINSGEPVTIGKRTPLPEFLGMFMGELDDIRFYNRVLLESEILALAAGSPIPP